MHLLNFDIDIFLRDYWQQKPLLIKNPWEDWINPLEPNDLAGLACEAEAESRLIVHGRVGLSVENGPIAENRFEQLGDGPWTLLVQAVDSHVPEVAALIEPFRFIPNWRIDDVMVSYASDGGGVGAHYDQYDVFLIQGLGKRRWQVGGHGDARCNSNTPLLPHDDLRLLADFVPVDEWVLEAGDILYVPPGVAHNGVAVGDDCMTYSVGFRAPSRGELIADFADDLVAELSDDDRYSDPQLILQNNPGEITAQAIGALQSMILETAGDPQRFARWFGEYNSSRKYPEIDYTPDELMTQALVKQLIAHGTPLSRNPASRFSFIRQAKDIMLFADGQCFICVGDSAPLAEILCAQSSLMLDTLPALSKDALDLLVRLINQGSLAFEDED